MDLMTKGALTMTAAPDGLPMVTRVTAADDVQGPKQGHWTYQDYSTIPDDGQRYEVVNGVLFMSPSPNKWHQKAVGLIFRYLLAHIEDTGLGEVYIAPFDVELTPHNIVQPDVLVLLKSHLERATDKRIIGAPDLVVEVASPATAIYDRHEKLEVYAHAGVKEYWIADPTACTIELRVLEATNHYDFVGTFQEAAKIPSKIIPNFPVHVAKLFAFVER